MNLNHSEVKMKDFSSETAEKETIIYLEGDKKILVLNKTATDILYAIKKALQEKRNITSEEIASMLCESYFLCEDQFEEICKDVNSTIESFFDSALLQYKRE